MAEDEPDVDLDVGDFLFQGDQELFLVVTGETETGYRFSVHGWREINNHRLQEYLDGEHGRLHRSDEIADVITEDGDEDVQRKFERLQELFINYSLDDEAQEVAEQFSLEDN